MEICCVCQQPLDAPVFESNAAVSITSLCQVLEGYTRVWHCAYCGHTQTTPLPSLEKFYAEDYHILINSEEEDQLYAAREGGNIYRTEHQVATLLDKCNIPEGAQLLDYGCGKASTLKALCVQREDIVPHVFDVGEQYRQFWDTFVPAENQAVNVFPEEWSSRFDGIVSFFALEHVADPRAFVTKVHHLLKEEGMFYFLVPNPYANTADLVVCDHVNHFSESSLRCLLAGVGFEVKSIDSSVHNSAWVILAEKRDPVKPKKIGSSVDGEVEQMAVYWSEFGDRVRSFERSTEGESAIYGSGFYGTYVNVCLEEPEQVVCFLDQNPHRQRQELMGKPIIAPDALPESVGRLYVGLNPGVAREVLDALDWGRELEVFYP